MGQRWDIRFLGPHELVPAEPCLSVRRDLVRFGSGRVGSGTADTFGRTFCPTGTGRLSRHVPVGQRWDIRFLGPHELVPAVRNLILGHVLSVGTAPLTPLPIALSLPLPILLGLRDLVLGPVVEADSTVLGGPEAAADQVVHNLGGGERFEDDVGHESVRDLLGGPDSAAEPGAECVVVDAEELPVAEESVVGLEPSHSVVLLP